MFGLYFLNYERYKVADKNFVGNSKPMYVKNLNYIRPITTWFLNFINFKDLVDDGRN